MVNPFLTLQTELAAVVVKELRKDQHLGWIVVPEMPYKDHTPSFPEDDSGDPFSSLFVFYARKALEFPEPVFLASRSYC